MRDIDCLFLAYEFSRALINQSGVPHRAMFSCAVQCNFKHQISEVIFTWVIYLARR